MRRLAGLVALALAAPAPAGAAARTAQPLVDVAPAATGFRDGVARHAARAFRATSFKPYAIPGGGAIDVGFSASYTPDDAIAGTYVGFLASLPHGSELTRLAVYIAPPGEVQAACGGIEGTLACYDAQDHLMIVPGEQREGQGVSTSYVVTHEYGHHVAAFRSNRPLPAEDFGPKYWSSRERVCDRSARGRLAPGNETDRYLLNPGEGWAEAYARLKYPEQPWTFTPLLTPDAAALAAARRDVEDPWTGSSRRTFRAHFTRRGSSTRTFRFDLKLDGPLSFRLTRPRGTRMAFTVSSLGKVRARDRTSSAVFSLACRQVRTERVTVRLTRRSGGGTATIAVTRAG